MPIPVCDIQLDGHCSCFYVHGVSNSRNFSGEGLFRKSRDTELDVSSFRHTRHILFGNRNQQPQTGSLFHPHDGDSNTGSAGRPHERSWMNVPLCYNAVKGRPHLEIPFYFAD